MSFSKLLVISRKIHRTTLFLTFFLGLIMAGSGMILKFRLFMLFSYPLALNVHSFLAVFFTAAFLITGITGILMYFLPEIIRKTVAGQQSKP